MYDLFVVLLLYAMPTFLLCIRLLEYSLRNGSPKFAYDIKFRSKRLNKHKILKYFLVVQGFYILFYFSGSTRLIYTLTIPLWTIYLLTVLYFTPHYYSNEYNSQLREEIDTPEYKDFIKSYERDQKIKKLLK